jgi:hypothetical protein
MHGGEWLGDASVAATCAAASDRVAAAMATGVDAEAAGRILLAGATYRDRAALRMAALDRVYAGELKPNRAIELFVMIEEAGA